MNNRMRDSVYDWAKAKGLWVSIDPDIEAVTIDLTEVEPGLFRKPEPHEDIHHPEYFDALKERAIDLKRNIS